MAVHWAGAASEQPVRRTRFGLRMPPPCPWGGQRLDDVVRDLTDDDGSLVGGRALCWTARAPCRPRTSTQGTHDSNPTVTMEAVASCSSS